MPTPIILFFSSFFALRAVLYGTVNAAVAVLLYVPFSSYKEKEKTNRRNNKYGNNDFHFGHLINILSYK